MKYDDYVEPIASTGVWYCPQCGEVEAPCDDVPSVNSGPCEASFYADDDSSERA